MTHTHQQNSVNWGIGLMVLSMLALPIVDAFAKILLQEGYSVWQVAGGRYFTHTMLMLAILLYCRMSLKNALCTNIIPKLFIAISSLGLTLGFYISLIYTSLSVALAILFTAPLCTMFLSVPFLKEKLTPFHFLTAIVGFIGILIIIRPSGDNFTVGIIYAFIAAVSWSIIMIVQRLHTSELNATETQFFAGTISTIVYGVLIAMTSKVGVTLATTPAYWTTVTFMGITAGICYLCIHFAHQRAKVTTLAPLQYLEIVTGLILDIVLFHITPDIFTWLGITCIVISGLMVLRIKHH